MDPVMEWLCCRFVDRNYTDPFREENAQFNKLFEGLPLELRDAKENLMINAHVTGFREGVIFGLRLGMECGKDPYLEGYI